MTNASPVVRFRTIEPLRRMHADRVPYLMLERGVLRVDGHSFLFLQDENAFEIPGSLISCLLLGPGASVSHEAVKLAGENAILMLWVGEGCTRLYAASHYRPNPSRLLHQATVHTDLAQRIQAAQRLYSLMFSEAMPPSYTIEKLRGLEGSRVRSIYEELAKDHGLEWDGRDTRTLVNECIGYATSCLYALSEVAILASGYCSAIGVIHSGDARSMVYDLADTEKFKTVVPLAFKIAKTNPSNPNLSVRHACRDLFGQERLVERLFSNLAHIMGE